MKQILVHGAVEQQGMTRLTSLAPDHITVLEAEMEELVWSVPEEIAPQVEIMFSTHPPQNIDSLTSKIVLIF